MSIMELDDEGFWVDEGNNQWGYCNSCGEEAKATDPCCEDGEVVPVEGA